MVLLRLQTVPDRPASAKAPTVSAAGRRPWWDSGPRPVIDAAPPNYVSSPNHVHHLLQPPWFSFGSRLCLAVV